MTATKRAKIERRIRQLENDLTVLHDEFYGEHWLACAELVGQTNRALEEVKVGFAKGNEVCGRGRN